MKKQSNLPHFPNTIFATAQRRLQAAIRQKRADISASSLSGYSLLFSDILPADALRKHDKTLRQRHFGCLPVFWSWLAQIFEANASCSKALSLLQSWYRAQKLAPPTGDTSGYCQARKRLKEDFLQNLFTLTTQSLSKAIRPEDSWQGFTLKAIDGSSVQLIDTSANEDLYPKTSGQNEGCGFPIMAISGLANLSHGGWEGFVTGTWKDHDSHLAPQLLHHLKERDLLMADRAYCSYELICRSRQQGAHILMRLHQARHRKLDWRKGKKISPIERLVTWKRPAQAPAGSQLTTEEWKVLPEELTLRYIKIGYEDRYGEKRSIVVVTTLLDPLQYDAIELSSLYTQRWEIEVKLRDVKTTLGMERFAVKSPEMAQKTLWLMMIAYNLLRYLMQKSAIEAGCPLCEMSFKGILDLLTSSHESYRVYAKHPRLLKNHHESFLQLCSTKTLNIRPYRLEPRAVKTRPKPYSYLTKHRHEFKEIPHKSNYRKPA